MLLTLAALAPSLVMQRSGLSCSPLHKIAGRNERSGYLGRGLPNDLIRWPLPILSTATES